MGKGGYVGTVVLSVVPGSATSAPPGNLLRCRFSGPIPDGLNQKLWVEPSKLCFNKPSRGSGWLGLELKRK